MLEKRKEDSDAVGKYQGIITSAVIAAIIIWVAPFMIPVLSGGDPGDSIFAPPTNEDGETRLPDNLASGIEELFDLLLWFVRLVLVFAVMVAVALLRIDSKRYYKIK